MRVVLACLATAAALPAAAEDAALTELVAAFRADAEAHRAYLEGLYSTTIGVVAVGLGLVAAGLYYLFGKTLKDARARVDELVTAEMDKVIARRVARADEELAAAQEQLKARIAQLDETAARLSEEMSIVFERGFRSPGRPRAHASAESPADRPNPRGRVLWVDDVPANNRGPAAVLRDAGFQVDEALDTEAAISRLAHEPDYDLVITDMGRAGDRRAGLTLLRRMREMGYRVPAIVYASPNAVRRTEHEARALGAVAAIGSGPRDLLAELGRHLDLG